MNRPPQSSQGVVLTGYHSNIDLFPTNGVTGSSQASHGPDTLLSCHTQQTDRHASGPANIQSSKPAYQRYNSQDSLDDVTMADYWREVEDISTSSVDGANGGEAEGGGARGEGEGHDEEPQKPAEEGEEEEAWLMEAGLARLFDDSLAADQDQDSVAFLSTLTRTQAAAVQKRVTSLQTLRRRNRNQPDVRNIFSTQSVDFPKLTERSNKQEMTSTETELNAEVSFSEQALMYRDQGSKVRSDPTSPLLPDDKLPDFKLLPDKTGQTKIGDLSPSDMKKVHRLVLVEMTALFDTAGIDLKAPKALKVKGRDSGLFGVPLSTLLELDQKRIPGIKTPIILQKLISHIEEEGLDTEGLLRVPGVATRIKAVVQELESSFYDGLFPWEQLKQHDAASLLKLFIRELPHPLLTVEYLNAFIAVNKLPTKKQQLQTLNLLVLLLPEANRDALKVLVDFLGRVVANQDTNKMSLNNVAVVMAPNIFMFKGFRSKVTEQQEVSMATGTANIVRLLIRYQNLLWTIPKFIVTQVRHQNVAWQKKQNREKAVLKLLKKITTDRNTDRPEARPEGCIRVQAPLFSRVSMVFQVTDQLKASDVISRISQDSSISLRREDLCLYEIGGNIKERCLDGDTFIKDLLQLNPMAEWVIRAAP